MGIKAIYKKITSLKTLTPNEEVNKAFTKLVSKSIQYEADGKLTPYELSRLQELSAKAEYELEKHWANRIINSQNPQKELKEFTYIKNYSDLTKLELYSLESCSDHSGHKVLFIGGGPLPMTSIMLTLEHGINSTIIDSDELAFELSTKLISVLGLEDNIKVIHANGVDFNYANFNVIYIAALAGLNSKVKNQIFKQIKKTAKKDIHLIARSSWRNRKLLYKPISPSIYKIFKPIIKVDPFNEIVNSVIVLKNA